MQLRVPKPGMGLSYATAVTCSPAFHLKTWRPSSLAARRAADKSQVSLLALPWPCAAAGLQQSSPDGRPCVQPGQMPGWAGAQLPAAVQVALWSHRMRTWPPPTLTD
eukprot:365720-Chlamydomonas_euryale.AAC.14